MSRLEFAPHIDEIKITDIQKGLGSFSPKPDKAVSIAILRDAIKKAGYSLAFAEITVSGTLTRDEKGWWLVSDSSNQRFLLTGETLEEVLKGASPDSRIEITGEWKPEGERDAPREVIRPRAVQKIAAVRSVPADRDARALEVMVIESGMAPSMTPVRTTSPGLTVYRGGAIVPRYSFTKQHLGNLKVNRHSLRFNLTYTPTDRVQLEADIPYFWNSFDDGVRGGEGHGPGNITLWGKYRFYRTLETWGDRQASVRFGLELPTGKKTAPSEETLPLPAFVRQQLAPISGGLSAHVDTSYSQAKGRFVYGANVEGIIRSERGGFRLGHEVRVNTDFEYVFLPRTYRSPTKELFLIFETTYARRSKARLGGVVVLETSSSEFSIAPALQYVPSARFLVEASIQIPLYQNAGPQILRTDRNILVGIRYLY